MHRMYAETEWLDRFRYYFVTFDLGFWSQQAHEQREIARIAYEQISITFFSIQRCISYGTFLARILRYVEKKNRIRPKQTDIIVCEG